MIGTLISVELLKIRRKGFWFLAWLGPFGVVAMQMVNYGVRKDWLFRQSDDHWGYYLDNVMSFTPMALVLGATILTSFLNSVENETGAWKQVLALPVSRYGVYLAKFTVLAGLLLCSSFLLASFTLAYGLVLELGPDIPWMKLIQSSFYPFFAVLPVLALQCWIATISQNQGVPIALGIVGTILTTYGAALPDWLIWKWPTLLNQWNEPLMNVGLGIGIGLVLYAIGMADFARRDVR